MKVKPYDLGLVVGRFQHITKGHKTLIDTAITLCDRVLILVGSAQEYGTLRNPFNVSTRIEMIRSIYGDDVIVAPLNDLTNENDIMPEWGKFVLKNCEMNVFKKPEVMIYGDDVATGGWFEPEDIAGMIKVTLPRNMSSKSFTEMTETEFMSSGIPDISATKVRELLLTGTMSDRRKWMQCTDQKIHKFYDRLRAELLATDPYQELYDNKINKI